jgi:hypothetical protein
MTPLPAAPRTRRLPHRPADWSAWLKAYAVEFMSEQEPFPSLRLFSLAAAVITYVVFSRLFEPIGPLPLFDRALALLDPAVLYALLPAPVLRLAQFGASLFTIRTLRHVVPPLLGLMGALLVGAAFLRDLLELPSLRLALDYLYTSLFGGGYPRMTISEGKATLRQPDVNPLLKVGGPGWVDIKLGSAALFERVADPSNVYGPGTHFIRRFETLREAFDLHDLERSRNDIRLLTRDGVPLRLDDMRIGFRIRTRQPRTQTDPFPVTVNAIRHAAYNRKVTERGQNDWADAVAGSVQGMITGWIQRRMMDELVPPPSEPTRPESETLPPPYRASLHRHLTDQRARQRLAEMGAELLWVSIGYLRPDPDVDPGQPADGDPTGRDKVHQQLIDTWKTRHEAQMKESLADAQALANSLSEKARVETECALILALTHDLRATQESGLPLDQALTNRAIELAAGTQKPDPEQEQLARILARLLNERPPGEGQAADLGPAGPSPLPKGP